MGEIICGGTLIIILLAFFVGIEELKEFIIDIIKAIKEKTK